MNTNVILKFYLIFKNNLIILLKIIIKFFYKMKLNKTQRQKREYDRQNKNKTAWELFDTNLSKLIELFHYNYKHRDIDWDTFCQQNKNTQLNSIRKLNFVRNQHKKRFK